VFVDAECGTDLGGSGFEEQLRLADERSKKIAELEESNADLSSKLDFLQAEYDDSEDYWQKKMEEERQYYEGHLNSLSEKLNSLLTEFQAKLAEYEEASSSASSAGGGTSGQASERERDDTKATKANVKEESLQQSTLPTILETDYEIQVMEAEADAKKWENLWAEAEEEKAEMAEEARRAIETLSQQWAASISTVHSTLLSQIDSLTSRV
jgi:molecular chaperone GrpE (heat shock protein)